MSKTAKLITFVVVGIAMMFILNPAPVKAASDTEQTAITQQELAILSSTLNVLAKTLNQLAFTIQVSGGNLQNPEQVQQALGAVAVTLGGINGVLANLEPAAKPIAEQPAQPVTQPAEVSVNNAGAQPVTIVSDTAASAPTDQNPSQALAASSIAFRGASKTIVAIVAIGLILGLTFLIRRRSDKKVGASDSAKPVQSTA